MAWIDKAGYAAAATWAKSNVLASYVGNMIFDKPVPVETTVRIQSRLIYTGNTSVHVQCRVVLPDVLDDDGFPTVATHVVLIYVAVDGNNKPIKVPAWEPQTEAAQLRQQAAKIQADEHRQSEYALGNVQFPPPEETTAELVTLRFLANDKGVYPGARVQAGAMMRWMDEAARVCASRWAGEDAVAIFAGGVQFYHGVHAGELLEIEARIVRVTPRSMYIVVRGWAGAATSKLLRPIAQGISVMVVPESNPDNPTVERAAKVPAWEPGTGAEVQLQDRAAELVKIRNTIVYNWGTPKQ